MLRRSDISADKLLDTMKAAPRGVTKDKNQTEYHCPNLPPDKTTHDYERENAVIYAQTYADDAQGDDEYNLYYPSYDSEALGGDCTNFISQAIYEGGNASLSIDLPLHPRDSELTWNKWYLLNGMQRAVAWNDVGAFYDFVTHPYSWDEGPEACSDNVTIDDIDVGDIIQYEKANDGNNNIWDHSVIVVGFEVTNNGEIIPLVASHSTDYREIPYTYYAYDDVRFIHIERSAGNPPVKPFIESIGDDAGTIDCEGGFVGNEVYLGFCEDHEVSVTSGFLFDGIEIPHGATIKYAFITFSVDGPYNNELHLKIYGEAVGDSDPFTASYPPLESRPLTSEGSAVFWNVTEQWDLTDNHAGVESKYAFTTPQLASVIEEIVHQDDWASGNALSIIIKDDGSTSHRRVIAKERADWDMWPNLFPARLLVAYEGGSPAPTSTPTETPTPTPTPTPTSTPTPTPTPTFTPTPTTSPEPTSTPIWNEAEVVLMKDEPAEKNEAFSALLSQVRDQVLTSSSKGDAYIDATYQHALEIMQLFIKDEFIRQEFKALALEVQPLLESMLDNRTITEMPRLDKAWVEQTIEILTKIEKQASPEFREEIRWWKEHLPGFVGKTGTEIWEILPYRSQ